jgi:hypothetical protein
MRLGTETASLINHCLSGTSGAPTPVEGMGATLLMWTDRHAYTIVEVSGNGRRIVARRDHATRLDANRYPQTSDSQVYRYAQNPDATEEVFTLRRNGSYVRQGDSMKGNRLRIGERSEYHDYSF